MCHHENTYFCELKHLLLFQVFSCQAARISSVLEKVGTWWRGVEPVISWMGNPQRLGCWENILERIIKVMESTLEVLLKIMHIFSAEEF